MNHRGTHPPREVISCSQPVVIYRAAVVIEWADMKVFTHTITINTTDTCASAAQCAIFGCEARLMRQSGCVRWGNAGLGGRRQRSMRDKPVRDTHTRTHVHTHIGRKVRTKKCCFIVGR